MTESEFAQKGKDAAKLQREIEVLDNKLKAAKDEHKAETGVRESELGTILSTIRRGKEDREVECEEVMDFEKGTVEYFHKGELMESRTMRNDERQASMNIIPMARD